jgi:hypothetical protein
VITALIGTIVGVLAFCIEHTVTVVTRARLHAMAWAGPHTLESTAVFCTSSMGLTLDSLSCV